MHKTPKAGYRGYESFEAWIAVNWSSLLSATQHTLVRNLIEVATTEIVIDTFLLLFNRVV